ncbi:SSI family serine proteinase inhibitor [Streptomyces sp. NPDC052225]|uniref:SSI family serine proteinase inhibitor n=1 Tax=Streptomyces sp. NPDC052225 TaxID=3154949 RepID=UPI003441BA86
MRSLPLAAAALLSLAVAVAAPAHAASDPTPQRGLLLTVSGDENTWIRGVLLRCAPEPSGHHPYAGAACAELDAAGGDLDALEGTDRVCTKEFAPVTVGATCTHRGKVIAWHKTYANACTMDAATGHVFRF